MKPTACNFLLQERSRIFMIPFVPNNVSPTSEDISPIQVKILKIQQQQQIQVWVF